MIKHIQRLVVMAMFSLALASCMQELHTGSSTPAPQAGQSTLPTAVVIPPGGFPTRIPTP